MKKQKRQRWQMFYRQNGLCCYCQQPMLLAFHHIKDPPKNLATYEHRDDRYSPERGKHGGEYRNAVACWQCNNDRARASEAAQPIEELHRRAGNGVARQSGAEA